MVFWGRFHGRHAQMARVAPNERTMKKALGHYWKKRWRLLKSDPRYIESSINFVWENGSKTFDTKSILIQKRKYPFRIGDGFLELGRKKHKMWSLLCADSSVSSQIGCLSKEFPDRFFFRLGISEANMMAWTARYDHQAGKIPLPSFANFFYGTWYIENRIRQHIAYMKRCKNLCL